MWGADCLTDNSLRWGFDPFKIQQAVVTCAEVGPASGRQEGAEGTKKFAVGRVQRCTTSGERGEGEVRPECLPARQMEQQQEWGDLSRRPSLRGTKCRLSSAWVAG